MPVLARTWLTALVALAAAIPGAAAAQAAQPRPPLPRARLLRTSHVRPPAFAISLQWVGDIALSTQRGLPPGGLTKALAPLRHQLRSSDLTVGNLEGTLSSGGVSKCAHLPAGVCFAFQAPGYSAGQLWALGFEVVNQANNHSNDFGPGGRAQTVSALHTAGVAETGFPGQITVRTVRGRRVAFVGFAPYPYDADLLNIPAAAALVRTARAHASLVVVIIHAGAEGASALHVPVGTETYLGENRGNPRAFAHAMIRAGAAVVLGSGPHVVRGIERYQGHLIAYSLGNFVGYHTLNGGGVLSESGILGVTLGPGGRVLGGRWFSIHLVDGLPRAERSNTAAHLVARLSAEDFPTDHFSILANGRFRIP